MIRVEGAAENNLRDVNVSFPGGITAVVGISGSGKSSLALDTLYHESRRRFLETLSLGSPALRTRPARVRAIHGLTPAVAVGQNVLNRNPASTLATAMGVHPFLRILYARFAERTCPRCGEVVTTTSLDAQLAVLRALAARAEAPVEIAAPLARGAEGSHERLLGHLTDRFPPGTVEVDGRRWTGGALDPDLAHDIAVRVATVGRADGVRRLREVLESVAALGTPQVTFRVDGTQRTLSARRCARGALRTCPIRGRRTSGRTATLSPRTGSAGGHSRSCSASTSRRPPARWPKWTCRSAPAGRSNRCGGGCRRCRGWAWGTSPSTARRRPCRAAKRSASGSRSS